MGKEKVNSPGYVVFSFFPLAVLPFPPRRLVSVAEEKLLGKYWDFWLQGG